MSGQDGAKMEQSDLSLGSSPPSLPLCLFFSHLPERLPSFLRPSDPDQISKGEEGWIDRQKQREKERKLLVLVSTCYPSHVRWRMRSRCHRRRVTRAPFLSSSFLLLRFQSRELDPLGQTPSHLSFSLAFFPPHIHTFTSSLQPSGRRGVQKNTQQAFLWRQWWVDL